MFKKIFLLFCLILLSNCSAPSSAFLGLIFTGARTGSVYQASLSYGTNKAINELKELKENESFKKLNSILHSKKKNKDPIIQLTYIVEKIEISEVVEPEHLP
jgi:hypothetical protein